jgi:8-oxo-dGTP diphosphatase
VPEAGSRVVLALTGAGNPVAAALVERAIATFAPRALLFAGVAGALKADLALGDVIVATRIYSYHGATIQPDGFHTRPRAWDAPHDLEQLAHHIERAGLWRNRLPPGHRPAVHFGPVAAGEVVLNSTQAPLTKYLHHVYNDAVAIEMESAGVFQAAHLNRSVPVLTVRAISDRADGGKQAADRAGSQPVAAANAAAFAIALITLLPAEPAPTATATPASRTDAGTQTVISTGSGPAVGVIGGSVHFHGDRPPHAPDKQT